MFKNIKAVFIPTFLLGSLFFFSGCSTTTPTKPNNNNNYAYQPMSVVPAPKGERIFFIKKNILKIPMLTDTVDVGQGDIYSISPNGTNLLKHTSNGDQFFVTDYPEISSNGKTLTFTSNYYGWFSACYTDIFSWDFASNTVTRISGDQRPTLPTKTAQLRVNCLETGQIRISAKGCKNYVNPTTIQTDSGQYSSAILTVPASENIWVKAEYNRELSSVLYAYVPEGKTEEVSMSIQSKDGYVVEKSTVSPDGRYICAIFNGKLCMWDNNISSLIWWKDIGGSYLGVSDYPSFSHDGNKLAYGYGAGGYANVLAVLSPPDTTSIPKIIVPQAFGNVQLIASPCWSPDDSKIYFLGALLGGKGTTGNIYSVNSDGTNLAQLTNFSGNYTAWKPTLSPDGSKIAFTIFKCKVVWQNDLLDFVAADNLESANIYIMQADGSGQPIQVTSDNVSYNPSWGIVK